MTQKARKILVGSKIYSLFFVVGNRSFSINFSAKITTNKKDIASSDLKIYNDISDVEDIVLLL